MPDLATQAQLDILADTLGVPLRNVAPLARLGPEGLDALTTRISAVICDDLAQYFGRVSRLAPLIPNSVIAQVCQARVPPLVAGRAAGQLGVDHPERIGALLTKFDPAYLADCAPYLDPRLVAVHAPQIEPRHLVPVAAVLFERGDYLTASRFLEYATPALNRAFLAAIDDNAGILRAAALVPSGAVISRLIRDAPRDRINDIVLSAPDSDDTVLAGASLLARIDEDLAAELGQHLVDHLDDRALGALVSVLVTERAVKDLVVVIDRLPGPARRRLLAMGGLKAAYLAKRVAGRAATRGRGLLAERRAARVALAATGDQAAPEPPAADLRDD